MLMASGTMLITAVLFAKILNKYNKLGFPNCSRNSEILFYTKSMVRDADHAFVIFLSLFSFDDLPPFSTCRTVNVLGRMTSVVPVLIVVNFIYSLSTPTIGVIGYSNALWIVAEG